jgi:hypothetical protein
VPEMSRLTINSRPADAVPAAHAARKTGVESDA